MQKLLTLILVAVLCFGIFAVTACEKNPESSVETSISTSVEENSSDAPTSRKSRTRTSKPGQSGSTASDAPTTSNGGGGGTSGNNGQVASGEKITLTSGDGSKSSDMNYLRYLVFIDEVNSLEVSEFSTYSEYLDYVSESLAKIDSAYNALPAAEKEYVADCKASCDAAKSSIQGLKDQAVADDFSKVYEVLLNVPVLKNVNVADVYKLSGMISSSESILSARVADFATKKQQVSAWYDEVESKIVEYAFIAQDSKTEADPKSSGSTKRDGILDATELTTPKRTYDYTHSLFKFDIHEGSNSNTGSYGVTYSDRKNVTPVQIYSYIKLKTLSFTPSAPGTLTLYLRKDREFNVVVKIDGVEYKTVTVTKSTNDADVIKSVEIDRVGAVTVENVRKNVANDYYLYAIKYRSPNLG